MLSLFVEEYIQTAAWSLLWTAAALAVDVIFALGLINMVCLWTPDWFAKASQLHCNSAFLSSLHLQCQQVLIGTLFVLQLVVQAVYSLICVVTWRLVIKTSMLRREPVSKLPEKVIHAKVSL